MKVLVLGGYGLLGAACIRALVDRGFDVTGVGRSRRQADRSALGIRWIIGDLARFEAQDWARHLEGIDIMVNAAGALQDGLQDDVTVIHELMIHRLIDANPSPEVHIIQISAAGASDAAPTEFMRSKARGDAILMASDLRWTVLRPTLVIGRNAHGGTALLRGAAGLPGVGPSLPFAGEVQTVALDDLADAVADCADGSVPTGAIYDLTEGHCQRNLA